MGNDYKSRYALWCEKADEATRAELLAISDDEQEIKERFFKELSFGTAGLRGVIGAGTDRMNLYTVRRATQGLASYILQKGGDAPTRGVAISYDPRHFSKEFAHAAAQVLAGNGIRAFIYSKLQPTPALSFAVRYLKTAAGIMITASHNPAKYNGYKVYGEDGAQLNVDASAIVLSYIQKTDIFDGVLMMDEEEALAKGLITIIDEDVFTPYIEAVKACRLSDSAPDLSIVYTPFHGAGYNAVMRVLSECGFNRVYPVTEQAMPDPDFSTVESPNPENPEGFYMALDLAKEKNADIIIGTDPDSDRIGVLCRTDEGYKILNGNQTGVILLDYILTQKKKQGIKPEDYVISTVVSTNMVKKMADYYGARFYQVYTGFKFIAGVIKDHEDHPDGGNYLFGFEESFGYLPGTYARDKDAVSAALLICEAADLYKKQGKTFMDVLDELQQQFGYFAEITDSIYMEGLDGMERMKTLLKNVEENPFREIGDAKILAFRNYNCDTRYDFVTGETSPLGKEPANVLYFELENDGFFILRPSGTEPKIKVYYSVVGGSREDAEAKLSAMRQAADSIFA